MRISPLAHRRSWRLPEFSYSGPWTYFITFVTAGRRRLLADLAGDRLRLLSIGQFLSEAWLDLHRHPPSVEPLDHVVMPDHFHGIVRVRSDARGSLWRAVNGLKGEVTRRARRHGMLGPEPLWARSFHDWVIRSESQLREAQRYIEANPARWMEKRRD
ncbi:MAG: transposase [Gemmatimonadales bacterium]